MGSAKQDNITAMKTYLPLATMSRIPSGDSTINSEFFITICPIVSYIPDFDP